MFSVSWAMLEASSDPETEEPNAAEGFKKSTDQVAKWEGVKRVE